MTLFLIFSKLERSVLTGVEVAECTINFGVESSVGARDKLKPWELANICAKKVGEYKIKITFEICPDFLQCFIFVSTAFSRA